MGGPVTPVGWQCRRQPMPEHGFDPDQILRVLSEQGVEFVLIGGYATALHGSNHLSFEPSGTEGWPDCRRRAPPRRSGVQTDTEGARATASAVSHSRPTWSEPSSSSSSFSSNDVST